MHIMEHRILRIQILQYLNQKIRVLLIFRIRFDNTFGLNKREKL